MKILFKKFCTKNILKTDVLIVGGGTIGMTLSSLLKKYNVDHLVIEKEYDINKIMDHPKAHYISPKTVEVLNYFNSFKESFFGKEYLSIIETWRHYRYCEFLIDRNSYLGEIDHLKQFQEQSKIH